MVDLGKAVLFTLITFLSSFFTYQGAQLAKDINIENKKIEIKEEVRVEEKEIMTITIPKLNIKNKIFQVNSNLNNIDKNVIIMKGSSMPDQDKGILLIGAHSGVGKYAYFKNLNKINIDDDVIINYNNKSYSYKVTNKYLDKKDGSISFNYLPNSKRLILYTCNPNDKNNFLIVVCE